MITVRTKQELTGAHIFFDKVSVGATMNGMLSAVMALSLIHIYNIRDAVQVYRKLADKK